MALIKCKECGKEISSLADSCPHCGYANDTAIKCPNCKSTNVHKISGLSKAGSVAMFGVFSLGKVSKTYQCDSCKFRW